MRLVISALVLSGLISCGVIEKSSRHGFQDGYYRYKTAGKPAVRSYVDAEEDRIRVFPVVKKQVSSQPILETDLKDGVAETGKKATFTRNSLDIDLTSVLMKYRPARAGRPAQLGTDFNLALYAGWRRDEYSFISRKDPLKRTTVSMRQWGFDAGAFFGIGSAQINSFSTLGNVTDDYSGLSVEAGFAAFAETTFASFGLAAGWDHLTGRDRHQWIYQNRPWAGLIIGVALN